MLVMPTVYVTENEHSNRRFHRDEDCRMLKFSWIKGIHPIDLNDLRVPLPCKICYPDAPRIKVRRQFCRICHPNEMRKKVVPCQHNGGIPVIQTITWKRQSMLIEPGDTTVRTRYVWPDKLHHYMSA